MSNVDIYVYSTFDVLLNSAGILTEYTTHSMHVSFKDFSRYRWDSIILSFLFQIDKKSFTSASDIMNPMSSH